MPVHPGKLTNGQALQFINPYTTSRLSRSLLESEKDSLARAESELFWLVHNGRGAETISQEIAALMCKLHNRNDPDFQVRVALVKILANAVRESEQDSHRFLLRLRREFEEFCESELDQPPRVQQDVQEFFRDLRQEIHPLSDGVL